MLESSAIIGKFSEVITEYLFIEVAEKMEWLDANVSAFQAAFEKAPEVFESVGVNLSVNVPFRMVNNFMRIMRGKKIVGCEGVGIDHTSSRNVFANLSVDGVLLSVRDYSRTDLPAAWGFR